MDRKAVGRFEIKDADKGTFAALIAQFNVVDSDGDVTNPGALPEGKTVPVSSYGHTSWEGALPVGSSKIRQTRTEAVAEGRFYLDTPNGHATWSTLKAMQDDGTPSEWSYGYDPKDYSFGEFEGQQVRFLKGVDVFEVSPTLRGAGVGTRTLDIKSRKEGGSGGNRTVGYRGGIPVHEADVVNERWNPTKAFEHLGLGASIVDLRAAHAWFDPGGDPEHKSSYRFLHHERSGGPANLRACYLAIAALNGAKGGDVPAGVRSDVYDHLASHIRDADREPPELGAPGGALKLRDQAMVILADLTDLTGTFAEVGASRALKRERAVTRGNAEILRWIRDELKSLDSLLDSPDEDAFREYLRFVRLTTQ